MTHRLMWLIIGLELPFLPLAALAFTWALGYDHFTDAAAALALVGAVYLAKTAVLVAALRRSLAPVERALCVDAAEAARQSAAAAIAGRRATLSIPLLEGLGWAVLFLLPAVLLALITPDGLPHRAHSLVSASLFALAVALGVIPIVHGVCLWQLGPAIGLLSLAARAAAARPPRGLSVRTRLALFALCLSLGPLLWVASMAHAFALRVGPPAEGVLGAAMLFGVIALFWAPLAAAGLAAAIGGPLESITKVLSEISSAGAITSHRAPVQEMDEIGALAEGVNQMADQLAEVERTKQQFVSTAAHELKTPLSIIRGYAELMHKQPREALDEEVLLSAIERGVTRMDRIVRYLLDFAQVKLGEIPLRKQWVDLEALVREVAASEATRWSRQVRVVGTAPRPVRADRDLLRRVIRALLDNAFKFSPGGEPVDVSIQPEEHTVQVEVIDRGVGISADRQPRIFEPFYRAHAGSPMDLGGLGIGLYLSKEIIRGHGGAVGFTSREGEGSRFWLRVPVEEGDVEQSLERNRALGGR